ncbi:cytochrome P450 [Paenibacillus sp. SYP-B3998]|uniref:Cytochrome P450 n=1 Tax=Paenibacillus sp. SYP-B3998 TaxID=2678564 RepID=A0A6G3ZYQ6_9BACL|nr:cytochrome P450 [Paenibacillus sp. SYP-B3998]NEW06824.1 cytochrome P450 [Paenibacillus sp. SYP-B3998]
MNQPITWDGLNPFPLYRQMRDTNPVYKDTNHSWNVFRYEDVKQVLNDHNTFSSQVSFEERSILSMDPPRHQKYRSMASQLFTPKMSMGIAPRISTVVKELISALRGQEETDLVRSLSIPLPLHVLTDWLGVPPEDRLPFQRWSELEVKYNSFTGGMDAYENESETLQNELCSYFQWMIDNRRREPKDDLVSALLSVKADTGGFTDGELVDFCFLLIIGGIETTAHLLTNTVLTLDEHPEVIQRIGNDPDAVSKVIDEVLRYRSPVQSTFRIVLQDIEIGGHLIGRGEPINVWLGAANRDERVFDNAEAFDIDRKNNTNHLAFSSGIHHCLGVHLAKLEVKIAITELLTHLSRFERIREKELVPIHSTVLLGLESLPINYKFVETNFR